MGIRKPSMSVAQVRHLATVRQNATSNATNPSRDPLAGEPGPDKLGERSAQTENASVSTAETAVPLRQQKPQSPPGKPIAPTTSSRSDASTKTGKAALTKPAAPISARNPVPTAPSVDRTSLMTGSDRAQVFVSAPYPAPGSSATFEIAMRHYPPRKALQMIMRRAMQDYDLLLQNGRFNALPQTYPTDPAAEDEVVTTSRMMSVELLRIARAHFDPLGLESTRAFGRKLATAALAAFFAQDAKR